MTAAQLLADEDFPDPVVGHLRDCGHNILTCLEAGRANQGIDDEDVLAFATSLRRAVLTRNRRHFNRLHKQSSAHAGIISITDDPDFAGQAARIHEAILRETTLAGLHVRVNRPNLASK